MRAASEKLKATTEKNEKNPSWQHCSCDGGLTQEAVERPSRRSTYVSLWIKSPFYLHVYKKVVEGIKNPSCVSDNVGLTPGEFILVTLRYVELYLVGCDVKFAWKLMILDQDRLGQSVLYNCSRLAWSPHWFLDPTGYLDRVVLFVRRWRLLA